MKVKARIVSTKFGDLLVTDFLYNLWQSHSWPTDEALQRMVANYQRFGFADGGSPEYGDPL